MMSTASQRIGLKEPRKNVDGHCGMLNASASRETKNGRAKFGFTGSLLVKTFVLVKFIFGGVREGMCNFGGLHYTLVSSAKACLLLAGCIIFLLGSRSPAANISWRLAAALWAKRWKKLPGPSHK